MFHSLAYYLKPCVTFDFDRHGNQSIREMAKIAYIDLRGNRRQLVSSKQPLLFAVHPKNVVVQNTELTRFFFRRVAAVFQQECRQELAAAFRHQLRQILGQLSAEFGHFVS